MARTIEVTPERLESAATKIEGLAAEYQTSYNQMYNTTDAMHSTWAGADNTAFINQIEGFRDDFKEMYSLMLRYVEYLRESANAYKSTQQNVIEWARKLRNNA